MTYELNQYFSKTFIDLMLFCLYLDFVSGFLYEMMFT